MAMILDCLVVALVNQKINENLTCQTVFCENFSSSNRFSARGRSGKGEASDRKLE